MGNSQSGTKEVPVKNSKLLHSATNQISVGTNKFAHSGKNQISNNQKGIENSNLLPSKDDQITNDPEEIIIMSSVHDMVKHFVKENAIIWCDPNVNSSENTDYITELKNICDIQVFVDWKEASDYLKKETQLSCCHVITSETNGELFVKEIASLPLVSSIYVFCKDIDIQKAWTSQYRKVVSVESNFELLLEKISKSMIKWQRTSSSLKVNLPSFAPIFDDTDLSKMNHLQLYLQGLVNFTNRAQAKKDFLNLARALYGKNKHIQEFDKNYNQYDMKAILNWYTEECFLYRLTNNCLRVANSDSVQYCRLALKDLENAIKEKYKQDSHKFSGLLYRGAYLSDNEWARLQQNTNREIEMHGFLSTTKKKEVSLWFLATDRDKKAMITIIVPNFPDKGEQGFAEMRDYTAIPEEDEVLFNVRSRFTVLEATVEEIDGKSVRHLVLLYGAQAMRRYTTALNPVIELEIEGSPENVECKACNQRINIGQESVIAVNISNSNEYFCRDCIKQTDVINKIVLVYVCPSAHGLLASSVKNKKTINIKIEGIVMQYQDSLSITFHGENCALCKGTKFSICYKCLYCKDSKMIYCNNCIHDPSMIECLRKRHVIVVQGYPFSFWSDKMSKAEENHLKYHREQLEKTDPLFPQENIFYNTHNYRKAIEYLQRYLEKNGDSINNKTAVCYGNIGSAYERLGEYQKSIEYYSKSLEMKKFMFGDNHVNTATSYDNLGSAYSNLGEYQKTLEYYLRSLKIRKAALGQNHLDTAASYNNLGSVCLSLGKYQKVIEYYSESLKIREAVLGENHPETASCYNNLGEAYRNMGDFQKAIQNYSKALEIDKIVFGEIHPSTAISYNNLGISYDHLGDHQKAIEYISKGLEIGIAVFGDNHPDMAASYNNLGSAYQGLEDYQKALEFFLKALDIHKVAHGDNHAWTAGCYINIGGAYKDLGDYQKAIEYSSKSLEVHRTFFGKNHPGTAASYSNLGEAYYSLGEHEKAIEYYSKSLEIRKVVLEKNHHDTAYCYNNMGEAYYGLKDYQKAIECYSKCLDIMKVVFGNSHLNTLHCYNNLGQAYKNLGEYQKVIKYYSISLEINKEAYGENHHETAACYTHLASAYYQLREDQKAIEYYSKSLEIHKAISGESHSDTASCYNNLGEAYKNSGDYQKAIEYCSKSLEIYKAGLGDDHPNTAVAYNNIGSAYDYLGDYEKAIEHISKALEIHVAVYGDNHPDNAAFCNNLGSAYSSVGDYEKAIEYCSKSLEIYRAVLGDDHPNTAVAYTNLGEAYDLRGESQKAIEYCSKSLDIMKSVFGDNHPNTIVCFYKLESLFLKSEN